MKFVLIFFLFFSVYNAHSQNNKTDSLTILLKKSNFFVEAKKYKDAKKLLFTSLNYQKKNNVHYNLGKEYLCLGQVYKNQYNYDSAFFFLDLSIESFISSEDDKNKALAYLEKGRGYRAIAQYPKSFNNYKKSITIYEALKDTVNIGLLKLNIGNVFNEIKNFKYALKYYHEAVKIYKKYKIEKGLAGCYTNIGNIYTSKEVFDSASHYLNKGLVIRLKNDKKNQVGYIYQNLASVHLQQLHLDSAKYFIDKSFEIHKENPKSFAIHLDYYFYGEIYKEKKDYKNANKYYKITYDWAINNNVIQMIPEVALSIAEAFYENGRLKESAYYYHQHKVFKDSNNVDVEKVEKEFINYEIVKDSLLDSQAKIQQNLLEIEKSNLELKKTISNNNTMYLSIVILIILILGYFLYKAINKRLSLAEQHKKIVEEQNEELKRTLISKEEKETLLKEIHHRVKNNLQIINSLVRLQSNYVSADNYQNMIIETENRIRSMSLVHEKLYKSNNLSELDVRSYLEELVKNILESLSSNKNISFTIQTPDVNLSIDTLIPLGLIINEIVSNSIKYAFTENKKGMISIVINEELSMLNISDNGVGSVLSYEKLSENSLGMELIESLADQLDGELIFNGSDGFSYSFTFDKLK